jgi:hypothetical protein
VRGYFHQRTEFIGGEIHITIEQPTWNMRWLACRCRRVIGRGVDQTPGAPAGDAMRFARYVLDLARHMTMSDVAQHLGLNWNLVKNLMKEELERRFSRLAWARYDCWPSMISASAKASAT